MYKGRYEAPKAPANRRRTSRPAPQTSRPASEKTKRKVRVGAIVYYSVLLLFVLVICIALSIAMKGINNWLVSFEASQPTAKCEAVFKELFTDPDWQEIYKLSTDDGKISPADYETYMTDKVGDQELNYIETSAGLSGDKKYIVRCGSEKVATFTLCNQKPDADIPQWELGTVEVFYTAQLSISVVAPPDYTVLVNGEALDDSHVIRTTATKAEDYLPEGVHGYRLSEMEVHALLVEPEIQILDSQGNPVEPEYDEQTRCYRVDIQAPEITEEHSQPLVTAAETYCKYMIGDAKKATLSKYFDSSTQIYQTITQNTTWMQSYASYKLDKAQITDYYCYNDEYYSARVSLKVNVTRKNGTVKEYQLDNTFFMKKTNGQWLVLDMINSNPQDPVTLVRLTYICNHEVIQSEMVDAHTSKLTLPEITVPEGKSFAGWFTKVVDEDGVTTTELAFEPTEDGTVRLSNDSVLEPMTLYALFS